MFATGRQKEVLRAGDRVCTQLRGDTMIILGYFGNVSSGTIEFPLKRLLNHGGMIQGNNIKIEREEIAEVVSSFLRFYGLHQNVDRRTHAGS